MTETKPVRQSTRDERGAPAVPQDGTTHRSGGQKGYPAVNSANSESSDKAKDTSDGHMDGGANAPNRAMHPPCLAGGAGPSPSHGGAT